MQPSAKPGTRRQRRPSLSNEDFLAKALDVFFERGFEGASIEEITGRAGIAKRTVYLRYGDKASLFKAALQQAIDDWILPVERLKDAEQDDLEASLLAIGQLLVDNILSPAGLKLLRLTNAESGRMPEMGVYSVHHGSDRTIAYLADLFRRHLGDPDGTPYAEAEDAAETFLHLVVGGPANAAAWGVSDDKAAIDRRIRFSVELFLYGLLAQSASKTRAHTAVQIRTDAQGLRELLTNAIAQLDILDGRIGKA